MQLLELTYYTLLATYIQDKQHKSLERKPFILEYHFWLSGFAIKDISGSHRWLQQKVCWYEHLPRVRAHLSSSFGAFATYCNDKIVSGAFQLLQLQEDIHRQFKLDGSGPENDVESHIRLNKDTLMNSLWKLNVVDIEVTLMHVCQMVSFSVSSNQVRLTHICSFLFFTIKL